MKISIINIANKMPQWVITACDEYIKRINNGRYSCRFIEIRSDKNLSRSIATNMSLEAKKIKASIPSNSFIIALDEKGNNFNSQQFAKQLAKINLEFNNIAFIIGGADGLHGELKQIANLTLQLSNLTFPHAMVRVILLEQIYRAITILDNHPYHRD